MKSGMKQTEIGLIPAEWKLVRLGEVSAINPAKPKGLSDDSQVSFVGMTDVSEEARLKTHHIRDYKSVAKGFTTFLDGDVLVAKITPCFENGKGALVSGLMNGIGFGSTEFHVVRAQAHILPEYIYYHTISRPFRQIGANNMTGSAGQKRVTKDFIGSYFIPLPPFPEQQKIAEILSTVDEKMAVIDEQLAQTQELKKGLMQRLLTKGIGHTAFKDSPLGKIPENWEYSPIDSHVSILYGFPFKSEKFNQEGRGVRLLRGINVTVGNLRWNDSIDRYWDEPFAEFEKYQLQEGDLVISMDGSLVGRNYARVNKDVLPLLLVQRVACLRAKSTLNLEYLRQIVGGPLFIDYVDAVKTSSGIPHISGKQIKDFKIPLPPLPEQRHIAEILTTVDDKLQVLTDKKAQYQELKRGLMQQLLTGQRRVKLPQPEEALA